MKYTVKIPSFSQYTVSEQNAKRKEYLRILEAHGFSNYTVFDTRSEADECKEEIANVTGLTMSVIPTRGHL